MSSLNLRAAIDQTARDEINALSLPAGAASIGASEGGSVQDYLSEGFQVVNVDHPPYSGDLLAAWNAISAGGKVVLKLGKRTYSAFGFGAMTKPNVVFLGAGVPAYDAANSRLTDGTGTVIQGQLYNQAPGLGVFSLGIDYGDYVRVNLAGGQYNDVFSNINVGENAGIQYGDLIILASDVVEGNAASNTHCILNQTGTGFKQTGIVEVIGGYHGHVIKVYDFNGDTTICRYQTADGLIIKCDAGASAGKVNLAKIIINGDNSRPSSGILLEAQVTSLSSIHIGEIIATASTFVIAEAAATTQPIVDVSIGSIYGGNISGGAGGITQAVNIGPHSVGYTIGAHALNACVKGGLYVESGAVNVDIGSGYSKSATAGDGYFFNTSARHGQLYAGENSGWGVNNASNSLLNAKNISCIQNTAGGISQLITLGVTLLNSWADGTGFFRAVTYGSEVRISGTLSGGTSGAGHTWTAVAQLASHFPLFDEYLSCTGFAASGAAVPLICKVTNTGEVQIYDIASQGAVGFSIGGFYVYQGNL